MRSTTPLVPLLFLLSLGAPSGGGPLPLSQLRAQTQAQPQPSADKEKKECAQNLLLIHDAIQAYRRDHKELPDSLSDLAGKYLSNPDLLLCPSAKRKGLTSGDISQVSQFGIKETKASYVYEFSPAKIPGSISAGTLSGSSEKSMREWKRRQMGLVGSEVPVVRCHLHLRPLNLSFGGKVYESGMNWEDNFTNVVDRNEFGFDRLFQQDVLIRPLPIPARSPQAAAAQIDLGAHFNDAWTSSAPNAPNPDRGLPLGLREIHGVTFDLRAWVRLIAPSSGPSFPKSARIPLPDQPCRRLHLLFGPVSTAKPGTPLGVLILHFQNGSPASMPLIHGQHIQDPKSDLNLHRSSRAWKAANSAVSSVTADLFIVTWENPRAALRPAALELVSAPSALGLSLAAVTVEP